MALFKQLVLALAKAVKEGLPINGLTGHMGDTFGRKGFSSGSSTRVSKSKYPKS